MIDGASPEVYRAAFDAMVDGVIVQDADGRVIAMNAAAQRALEETRDMPSAVEVASEGTPGVFRAMIPQMHDETGSPLASGQRPAQQVFATGEPVVGQMLQVQIAGTDRWFRCNASQLPEIDSYHDLVALTFSDATAERQMADELVDKESQFRLAMMLAPIGMALVSSDGRFIDVNQALCELAERSRRDLLSCTFQDITHPDDLDADLENLNDLVAGKSDSYRMNKRYMTPDNAEVHVQLDVAIVRTKSDPYFIAQVTNRKDVLEALRLEQRALETERQRVSELRELDEAKTNFVSTVSHELRTPLTSTIGFLEVLADGEAGELNEQQAQMINVIERNSKRLLALVEDLLTLSELEVGQLRYAVEELDFGKLVIDAVTTQTVVAHQHEVTLNLDVDPTKTVVAGDNHQMERIVVQLVGNALKFTPPGGTVSVSTVTSDSGVVLSVADTGIGIPEEEQEALFQRFFRSSNALKGAVPGTGLGLAIVHDLVKTHGGTIEVDSAANEGTTVKVLLPVVPAAQRVR